MAPLPRPARCARSAGFSLIELLVVLSIVAVLIGLLLPSLAGARDAARRVVCLSNQRQIGVAFTAYTFDFKDHVPPMTQDRGADGRPRLADIERAFLAFEATAAGPSASLGQGAIARGAQLNAPGIFYCPGQTNPGWTAATNRRDWADQPAANRTTRAGYQYVPPVESDGVDAVQLDEKILTLGSRDLVLHDLAHRVDNLAHADAFNRLFADGSVSSTRSPALVAFLGANQPVAAAVPAYTDARVFIDRR